MRSSLPTSSVKFFSRHIKLSHKRNDFLLSLTSHIVRRAIGDVEVTINFVKYFKSVSTRGLTRVMRNGEVHVEVLGKLYVAARDGKEKDVLAYLRTLMHELTHVMQHVEDRPFGLMPSDPRYYDDLAEHEAKLSEGHSSEGLLRLLSNFERMKRELSYEYDVLDCTRK